MEHMNNDTLTEINCDGCMELGHPKTMTRKSWVFHDPYEKYGWALEEGERETGNYCDDCITDIKALTDDYHRWLNDDQEMTLEDWQDLAITLASNYSRSVTNWKDCLDTKQKYALSRFGQLPNQLLR